MERLSNSGLAPEAAGGGKTRSGAALQMLKGTEATQSEVPAVAVSRRCQDQPAPRPGKSMMTEQLIYNDGLLPIHPEDPWLHLQSNLPQT
ncbi:unnamed protein product [Boreogadus saida]